MNAPSAQYTRTSDGYDIAFAEAGSGQPVVLMHPAFSHIEYSWRFYNSWFQGLAERYRLVWYDPRGQGLSTRGLGPDLPLKDYQLDLSAVLDACELEDVILIAVDGSSFAAVPYAIQHPRRVKAVILITASIAMRAWPGSFHQDLSRENWDFYLRGLVPFGLTAEAANERLSELKEACTPEDWQTLTRTSWQWDISSELSRLTTPTLVLHPRHYRMLPEEEGRKLAALIPGARFALIPGDTLYGEAAEGIAAIETFLSSLPTTGGLSPNAISFSDRLSARESEVLALLAAGKSNQQIADELVISLNTVNRHVSNIYAKTGAANRAEAVGYAHRHGLAG
jgi:pimeloyl-ACP methyl ester carboxylesterase/DNA-binding CsgD family transcriptional regulator